MARGPFVPRQVGPSHREAVAPPGRDPISRRYAAAVPMRSKGAAVKPRRSFQGRRRQDAAFVPRAPPPSRGAHLAETLSAAAKPRPPQPKPRRPLSETRSAAATPWPYP